MYDIAQQEINSVNGLGDPVTTTTTATKGQWLKDNALDLINTAGNVAANIISATHGNNTSGNNNNYVGGNTATQAPVYITPTTTTEKKEMDWTPIIIGGVALVAVLMFMNKK